MQKMQVATKDSTPPMRHLDQLLHALFYLLPAIS